MHSRHFRAFTLIELLIVVAIIAILAAIAVPNFLEAQMRAKVSRVKNDMRSLATAIEAYSIDNNGSYIISRAYPNVGAAYNPNPPVSSSTWVQYSVRLLTTPVAYMTSLPGDPFVPAAQLNYSEVPGNIPERPSFIYQWYDSSKPEPPSSPNYAGVPTPDGVYNIHYNYPAYFSDSSSVYFPSFQLCVGHMSLRKWFLISHGVKYPLAPNNVTQSRSVDWRNMPYDSTNGTASQGMIIRTGP